MTNNLRQAIEGLLNLAKIDENDHLSLELYESASEEEIIECLVANLKAITPSNAIKHCSAMQLRSYVLHVMKTHLLCAGIQENGSKILSCIYASATKTSEVEVQELEAIKQCLKEHHNSQTTVAAACSALRNYCVTRSILDSSHPQTLACILSESVVEVVNAMSMCQEEEVLGHASGALWSLCASKDGLALSLEKNNAIGNIIESMERFPKSAELQKNCIGILWLFFSVTNKTMDFLTDGCVVAIVRFITEFEEEEDALDIAINTVLILTTKGFQAIMALVDHEMFIDSIVGCMFKYPNSPSINGACCDILSNISLDQNQRADICARGGTSRIISALKQLCHDRWIVCKAFGSLANLVNGADVEILCESEASENMLHAMQAYSDDCYVQIKAAGALWSLSARHDVFKDELVHLGGARMISEAMDKFVASGPMQARGFVAIWSLAVPRNLKEEVGRFAAVPVVNGLSAHISSGKICEEGLGALKCLSAITRNKEILAENDAVDCVYSCMWLHSENAIIQQAALAALSNISVDVDTNQVSQISRNDLDTIINAMRTHRYVKNVQNSAIILLRNFTFSPSNKLILQEYSNLAALVCTAVSTFNDTFQGRAEDLLHVLPSPIQ